jgi:3'-phosphoadenosine 5'-phosphosulfate sulfotransferase (PAPS reductase)/FAD synthetase
MEIDRILDIMEPGTLALSFNGGKDACAMMHLVREANVLVFPFCLS